MKDKLVPVLFFLLFALIVLNGCKKNKELPACGCSAPATDTIAETSNLKGEIMYFGSNNSKDFQNKYVIVYTEKDCINCKHYLAICNESVLPAEVLALKSSKNTLQVSFSGVLKPVCEKVFAPADNTYDNVSLTKIVLQ
ncbi:hypothetical protein SAMN05444266_105377 [Chitinophaga jiangningensis]|uniref:Uncharacterized protein n=2 Tax=Chitinophaga jiangningensis TaxID=1419482 RepID=A0A1M7EBV3_9BACT|nr:hypothetical protein SAMN05444266_105377 [Chitinophaga jiangningensis]